MSSNGMPSTRLSLILTRREPYINFTILFFVAGYERIEPVHRFHDEVDVDGLFVEAELEFAPLARFRIGSTFLAAFRGFGGSSEGVCEQCDGRDGDAANHEVDGLIWAQHDR